MRRTYRSFAKVNLHLQVVGRRADGYHELRTLFQTIDLHDLLEVELTAAPGVDLEVAGAALPADQRNLAARAAAAFLERWAPDRGARLRLEKRIPVGGGLGGGSSNAATTLLALRELTGVQPPPGELWLLARELGADVPYFLVGGTALGCGRGDEVLPVPELEPTELWLAVPPVEVSTARIFAALAPPPVAALDAGLLAMLQGDALPHLLSLPARNELEATVLACCEEVRAVYNALVETGASLVRLSGSGATVFAVFVNPADASQAAHRLPPGSRFVRAVTLSRAELASRRGVH